MFGDIQRGVCQQAPAEIYIEEFYTVNERTGKSVYFI